MANFEDFKQKAKDAVGTIADVSIEVYKLAEEKAKVIARTTKLNSEISREKSQIRRLYLEIGKTYYELHKDDTPERTLEKCCADITTSLELIAAKRKEIEELKNSSGLRDEDIGTEDDDSDIEVEIVEVEIEQDDESRGD